jgi:hypothetical protein
MPKPNYKEYYWCNMCEIPCPKTRLTCVECGYRVRTKSHNKKKESEVKRIE